MVDGGGDDDERERLAELRQVAEETETSRQLNFEQDAGGDDAPPPPPPPGDDEEEVRPRIPVGADRDDLADQIAELQEARQAQESGEFDGDLSKTANTLGRFADEDGDEAPAGEAPPAGQPPQEAPQDIPAVYADDNMLVKLTTRGVEEIVTVAEARRRGQIGPAGDSYVQDARKVLEEAKAIRDSISRGEAPPTPEQIREGGKHLTPQQQEDRFDLFEKIAYGNKEEVNGAFEDFQQSTVEQAVAIIEAKRTMDENRNEWEVRKNTVVAWLDERMPDMAENNGYMRAFGSKLAEVQRDALVNFVENMPDGERERLARHSVTADRLRALTSPKKIMEAYHDFAVKGHRVPPIDEVMLFSAIKTREELKMPSPPAQPGRGTTPADDPGRGPVQLSAERRARKEALTPQPARAGVGPGQSTQAARREVTESDFHSQAMADRMETGYVIPRRK